MRLEGGEVVAQVGQDDELALHAREAEVRGEGDGDAFGRVWSQAEWLAVKYFETVSFALQVVYAKSVNVYRQLACVFGQEGSFDGEVGRDLPLRCVFGCGREDGYYKEIVP